MVSHAPNGGAGVCLTDQCALLDLEDGAGEVGP